MTGSRAVRRRVVALGVLAAGAAVLLPAVAGSYGAKPARAMSAKQLSSMSVPKLTVAHLGEDYARVQLVVSDTIPFSAWVEVNGAQHCLTQLQAGSYQLDCAIDLAPGKVSEVIAVASDPQVGTHQGSDILANPAATDAPFVFGTTAGAYSATAESINGFVDPEGANTTWHVEYGPTSSLGSATPGQSVPGAPGGTGGVPSQAFIYGLTPGATYYYDVVASNSVGTTTTPIASFTVAGGTTTTTTTTTTSTTTTTTPTTTTSGSNPPTTTSGTTTTAAPPTTTTTGSSAPTQIHSIRLAKRTRTTGCTRGTSPDRRCSPGAYDSALTQAAICSAGFKGAGAVDAATARAVEAEYGMAPRSYGRSLEIDRIVSAELGGSADIANLFPEAGSGPANFHVKDRLEHKLHSLVCAGKMPLRAAQAGIAGNWQALYKRVFGNPPGR